MSIATIVSKIASIASRFPKLSKSIRSSMPNNLYNGWATKLLPRIASNTENRKSRNKRIESVIVGVINYNKLFLCDAEVAKLVDALALGASGIFP